MKFIFLLSFILQVSLSCTAQNTQNISCVYKVLVQDFTLEELNKITSDQNIRSNIINRMEEAKLRVLHLNGNQKHAFFYEAAKMKNDADPSRYQSNPIDSYYYSDSGKEVVMNTVINQEFFVKLPSDKYDWVVTTDLKLIDGFQCYKATGTHQVDDFRGKKNYNMIAWFCPSIPFNYGPAEFFGLPGLIFEAYYENAKEKFVLQSIQFPNDLQVPTLTDQKIISEAEFTKVFNTMMENIGN